MRKILRLELKNGFVVKGRMLEGVQKRFHFSEFWENPKIDQFNELFLNDSIATLYDWKNFFLENPNICYTGKPLAIGGGLKCSEDVAKLRKQAEKIVLNSICYDNPDLIDDLVYLYGSQSIIVAIDVLKQDDEYWCLKVNGKEFTGIKFTDHINEINNHPHGEIFINDVSSDGMLTGINIGFTEYLMRSISSHQVVIGGGYVNSSQDSDLESLGVSGVVISRAYLDDRWPVDK